MLARAICQKPEVIVLDEPTSFLDIRHKIELLDILQEMAVKDNVLSPANLASKVDYYKRQIVESGALERDRQRWTGYSMYGYANPEEEAEYIKSWYIARLKYLETIFNNF